jgi:hypothetical protein
MAPIGDPKRLNAQGWLDIAVESILRDRVRTEATDPMLYKPYVADLLDEIDRLRALLMEVRGVTPSCRCEACRRICAALANVKAQEF